MSVDELVAKRIGGMAPASQKLVEDVVKVYKDRKTAHTKELEYELGNYQRTMLLADVYSRQEVETLLSSFFTALQGSIQKELEARSALSAEFYCQLFACANAKGLSLDPPRIAGAISSTTPAFLQKDSLLKPANKLASLESATSDDAKVNEEIKQVEKENTRQQEKIQRITNQFQEMMASKAEIGEQLLAARKDIAALKEKHGGEDPKEVANLQLQIKKLKMESETARKALAARLNESPQFVNLKKMIAKKNEDLQKLRARLQNHELVYADDEDEADF